MTSKGKVFILFPPGTVFKRVYLGNRVWLKTPPSTRVQTRGPVFSAAFLHWNPKSPGPEDLITACRLIFWGEDEGGWGDWGTKGQGGGGLGFQLDTHSHPPPVLLQKPAMHPRNRRQREQSCHRESAFHQEFAMKLSPFPANSVYLKDLIFSSPPPGQAGRIGGLILAQSVSWKAFSEPSNWFLFCDQWLPQKGGPPPTQVFN